MKRASKAILWLLALLLTGCSTLYKRVDPGVGDVKQEDLAFKPGETHFHEVLDLVGPPSRISTTGSGFGFLYEAMLIRELQTGIGGREGFWQLLKFSFADSRLYRHTVILNFDQHGILTAASVSNSSEPLGKSGAVQPILSVEQIVDTKRFEDDAVDAVDWGAGLLDALPVSLNAAQSLNSGTGGFEQSGTTTKIGQHALEMRSE